MTSYANKQKTQIQILHYQKLQDTFKNSVTTSEKSPKYNKKIKSKTLKEKLSSRMMKLIYILMNVPVRFNTQIL